MVRLFIVICTFFISLASSFSQTNSKQAQKIFLAGGRILDPDISYTLQVDSADLTGYEVEMKMRKVSDTFRVAMVTHLEYDDKYWRFVENLRVQADNGHGSVLREDSSLWRITTTGGKVTLRYRIHLPAPRDEQHAVWRPFLSQRGGLVGGPHSFMYVLGSPRTSSHLTLKLPQGWMTATGLVATVDPTVFYASSVADLVDAPIMVGEFKSWQFLVHAVPHRIVYMGIANGVAFDTSALIMQIRSLVVQADTFFGGLPYREYLFLLKDGAYGALEHANSVTIGAPSSRLMANSNGLSEQIAHEYFHTWNLMRIHPIEFGPITYLKAPLSKGLWWSEGLTMFYADLLKRRAGLPTHDSSRVRHLEELMRQYFSNPGNSVISPEKVSLAAYDSPGMLGNYSASTHLQGELIGVLLDILIRSATHSRYSMDDVMRSMMAQFGNSEVGFTAKDVRNIITATCECNVESFFKQHIQGNKPLDFNKLLRLAGLRYRLTWSAAKDDDGKFSADTRVFSWKPFGEEHVRLGIMNPSGCWAQAGLNTGDQMLSLNGKELKTSRDFYNSIKDVHPGDTLQIEIIRKTGISKTKVLIRGFQQPNVHLEEIQEATEAEKKLRAAWLASKS